MEGRALGSTCPLGPAAPQSWMALLRKEIGHLHEKKDLPLDARWARLHPVPTPRPHVCNPVFACVCALLVVPPWGSHALSCPLEARHWQQPELWVRPSMSARPAPDWVPGTPLSPSGSRRPHRGGPAAGALRQNRPLRPFIDEATGVQRRPSTPRATLQVPACPGAPALSSSQGSAGGPVPCGRPGALE